MAHEHCAGGYQYHRGIAGTGGSGYIFRSKWYHSTCNCLSGQPDGPANGRCLAGGQGAGPAVCDPGRGVWLNRKRRIAGSECPAIF